MNFRTSTAYKRDRLKISPLSQRALLVAAIAFYAAVGWEIQGSGAATVLSSTSLAFLVLASAVLALTFIQNGLLRLDAIPILSAAIFSVQAIVTLASFPNASSTLFPLLFITLGFFVVALSLHLRAAVLALATTASIGSIGALIVLPAVNSEFSASVALSFWLPSLGVASFLAWILEKERCRAFVLGMELERRATSDDLTGVSNRAHINLLAQNEFARARRYKEPYSCLMLEIDEYETLRSKSGVHAADIVVQVLSGYCVVIMRHCDSFGRPGPHRFLALLPETEAPGASTLASRMCKDIAALDVKADGKSLTFTISIGAAELHSSDRWAGDLLRRTEQALEDAIERGGNIAVLAEPPIASIGSLEIPDSQEGADNKPG